MLRDDIIHIKFIKPRKPTHKVHEPGKSSYYGLALTGAPWDGMTNYFRLKYMQKAKVTKLGYTG